MIKEVIINTSSLLLVINFICYFIKRKNHSFPIKIFTLYLFIMVIVQVSSSIMAKFKVNNLFLSHYYFVGQFFLLSLFFRSILQGKGITKIIDSIIILVLSSICIYYLIFPHNYFIFNNFEIAVTSIPLIIYCFLFIVKKMEELDKKYFYIISGMFIYITGSTLLFSTGNIKLFSPMKKIVWLINSTLFIIYHILVFIEWYKHFRKKPLLDK